MLRKQDLELNIEVLSVVIFCLSHYFVSICNVLCVELIIIIIK